MSPRACFLYRSVTDVGTYGEARGAEAAGPRSDDGPSFPAISPRFRLSTLHNELCGKLSHSLLNQSAFFPFLHTWSFTNFLMNFAPKGLITFPRTATCSMASALSQTNSWMSCALAERKQATARKEEESAARRPIPSQLLPGGGFPPAARPAALADIAPEGGQGPTVG